MYNRLFKEKNPKFNPRTMIKDVIRRTLEDYTNHIRNGSFPPPSMFLRFGGKTRNRLSALDIRQLETLDPISSDRRGVLLEFWSDSNEIVNLPKPIHEAFHLTDLEVAESVGSEPDSEPVPVGELEDGGGRTIPFKGQGGTIGIVKDPKPVDPPKEKLPQALQDQLQEIEAWKNDGQLRQTIMQKLRESVFAAINDYIDWDSELLHLNSLVNEGIWKARCIHFVRSTTITPSTVQLILPLEEETLNDTAIVLQGILYYQHYKHWNFEKGSQYYRYFTRYLHRWSEYVLSEFKELKSKHGEHIPVVSLATETLAIGVVLSGRSLGRSLMDSIDALFFPMEQCSDFRSGAWKKLHKELKQNETEVKQNAFTRLGILKGQTKPFKLIDSAQLIKPLQSLRKGEFLVDCLQDTGSDFKALVKTHRQLRDTFESAIQGELEEKQQWLSQMEKAFGPDLHVKEGLLDFRKAMEAASNDGSFRGVKNNEYESLLKLVKDMEAMPVKGWVKQIKATSEEQNMIKQAQLLGNLDTDRMFKAKTFMETADRFLEESLRSVEKDLSDLEKDQQSKGIAVVT
ncbi:hypothetical protein ABWK46_23290, partial [Peribacillus frigoritolerans]|uniref:hypothetical protein n=1 Tax=Peribacillus frigoritolerans TaxID=450367 RepID=UPI003396887B